MFTSWFSSGKSTYRDEGWYDMSQQREPWRKMTSYTPFLRSTLAEKHTTIAS